jgi:Ca-activated chloride channel family protein
VSQFVFEDLRWLNLFWVVLAIAALGVYGVRQRRAGLVRFADVRLLPHLGPRVSWARALLRLACVATCLVLIVIAVLGPRWGESEAAVTRRGIDAMILLDVSRSMLARDLVPNRLERAKIALREDLLPALGGDRVGLIAFAGVPSLACPLTSDYGFFRLALEDVGPRSVARGGTAIGDALRKAADGLDDKLDSYKLVILITDGEDHESYPVAAARALWAERRIPVVAIGLGDPSEGARVPVSGPEGETYLQHEGKTVWSRADFEQLRQIAAASTLNLFVPVGTKNFDLGEIYRESIVPFVEHRQHEEQTRIPLPSRYHGFAVAALGLLLVESFLREGRRRPARRLALSGVAVATLLPGLVAPARADLLRARAAEAQAHFAAGRYEQALQACDEAPEPPTPALRAELLHGRAAALYKLGRLDDARETWVRAAGLKDAPFEAEARYNIGNCHYAAALHALEDQPANVNEVLALLDQAIEQYLDAVRLDPGLSSARANLELAAKLKREIREQSTTQPSSQPSVEPQPDSPSSRPDEPASQPSSQPDPSSGDASSEGSESQDQAPQSQPASESQPAESPSSTQPADSQPETQPASDPASQPAEQPQPQTQPAAESQPVDPNALLPLTPEEAQRLLQMVRDAERARREQLRARMASPQPVKQDW